jgi:hypothetical protein
MLPNSSTILAKASPGITKVEHKMSESNERFLSRNRLACLIAVLTFPFSELLALAHIFPLVMPVGQVIAINIISIIAVHSIFFKDSEARRARLFGGAAVLWLALAALALLVAGSHQQGIRPVVYQLQMMLIPILAFTIMSRIILKSWSPWRKIQSCLACIGCLFVGAIIAWSVLDSAVKFLPLVYDPVLYRIDSILFLSRLATLADLLNAHQDLHAVILILYKYNLIFALPAIFSEVFYSKKRAAELSLQLLVASFLVFPLFCLMPALAPAFYFGVQFPDHLPLSAQLFPHVIVAPVQTIRNTFPSLHATWAILICLAVIDAPVWHRITACLYLAATFIATIGFGEHYSVDWIGALPLVLLVRSICCASLPINARARLGGMIAAVSLLALWVLVVRGAPATVSFEWAVRLLALVSVCLPLGFEIIMARLERRQDLWRARDRVGFAT